MKITTIKQKLINCSIFLLSIYIAFVIPLSINISGNQSIKVSVNAATLDELQKQRDELQAKLDQIAKNKAETNKK